MKSFCVRSAMALSRNVGEDNWVVHRRPPNHRKKTSHSKVLATPLPVLGNIPASAEEHIYANENDPCGPWPEMGLRGCFICSGFFMPRTHKTSHSWPWTELTYDKVQYGDVSNYVHQFVLMYVSFQCAGSGSSEQSCSSTNYLWDAFRIISRLALSSIQI